MSRCAEIKEYLTNLEIPHCGAESITVMLMKLREDGLYLIEQLEGADMALVWHEAKLNPYEDFDSMGDDGEWQPPHPIFLLAEENDRYKATLAAIAKLPDEWRRLEMTERVATPEDPHALDGDDCADQLEAIIKGDTRK